MPQIVAYIRASSDKQDTDHQELEIRRYLETQQLEGELKIISINISSRQYSVEFLKLKINKKVKV